MRGGPSLKGKGGLVGFRKTPSLMVKRDGVILAPLIMAKKGQVDFLNKIPLF